MKNIAITNQVVHKSCRFSPSLSANVDMRPGDKTTTIRIHIWTAQEVYRSIRKIQADLKFEHQPKVARETTLRFEK